MVLRCWPLRGRGCKKAWMKFIALAIPLLVLASCCPFPLFSDTRTGAEPDIDKVCKPLVNKMAPGLQLDGELKVMGDWAFFLGDTVNDAGEAVTPAGAVSSDSVVLMCKLKGKWQVVDFGIGISDAYYIGWYEEHDLPEGLLEP